MIRVSPRARSHQDRAGDPLDGLVNMFDIGIVLSVAFLLAALSSLNLAGTVTRTGLATPATDTIRVDPQAQVSAVPQDGRRTIGRGSQVGSVYRLRDGRLIYVVGAPGSTPGSTTGPSPAAPPSPSTSASPSESPSPGP